ncbi:unnamed protein product [Effrenium voratum]|nr:unnamed protein product [Effrenium voratum]
MRAQPWLGCLLLRLLAAKELGCPALEKHAVGICVEECSDDSDCEAAGKAGHSCCSNGCGHACMKPGVSTAPSNPFALMAVLREAVFADVLAALPEPMSKSEMRSVKVLSVKYPSDQRRDACQAFHKLAAHPKVSSVEWDGASPNCAEIEL